MTYKQLIDTLTNLIDNHYLINQWGYGNLSDIETPETGAPNYPYTFINPVQVLIQNYGFDVTLNLIQMDQPLATVEAEIDGVSTSLGIIQDIIAKFKLTPLYQDADITLSVQCTPFKERFKDSVVGVTAIVTFQISEPLDACVDVAPDYVEIVHAVSTYDYQILPESGTISPTAGNVLMFDDIITTDGGWQGTPVLHRYYPQSTGTYRFEVTFDMTLTEPQGSEIIGDPPRGVFYKNGVFTYFDADVTNGWPTTFVDETTVYTVTQVFTDVVTDITGTYYEYVRSNSNGPLLTTDWYELAGAEIKIYKLAQ